MKFTIILLLVTTPLAAASLTDWQGEWGEYARAGNGYRGGRLSVTKCDTTACQASLAVSKSTVGGNAEGVLTLLGATSAQLAIGTQAHACTLRLSLDASTANRTIEVQDETGDCRYYTTSNKLFEGRYLFRRAQPFTGSNVA